MTLRTYDLARALRDAGVPVISGFHSPIEKVALLFPDADELSNLG